jgi:hypothetical protein
VVALRSTTAREGRRGPLRLTLSKLSTVTVTVRRGKRVVFARTVRLGGGKRSIPFKPSRPGTHGVQLRAVDPAGNVGTATGSIKVRRG